jgi:hypothetical protein
MEAVSARFIQSDIQQEHRTIEISNVGYIRDAYMDKLGLILLPWSRLQQPSQVHFHLVEPHIEAVTNSTQDMWGSDEHPKNLEIKLLPHLQQIDFFSSRGRRT